MSMSAKSASPSKRSSLLNLVGLKGRLRFEPRATAPPSGWDAAAADVEDAAVSRCARTASVCLGTVEADAAEAENRASLSGRRVAEALEGFVLSPTKVGRRAGADFEVVAKSLLGCKVTREPVGRSAARRSLDASEKSRSLPGTRAEGRVSRVVPGLA